jgi:hypothetical protein
MSRRAGIPIGALAIALLVFLGARSAKGGDHPQPPGPGPGPGPQPGGNDRPKRLTGFGGDWAAWTKSRVDAALHALKELPLLDPESVAYSVVAHWAIETGWGSAEYNFNVGNIKARAGEPYVTRGEGRFRAYDSLNEGISAYADLLRARYTECIGLLMANPESAAWYDCLGRKGYYASRGDIEGARAKVARLMGLMP